MGEALRRGAFGVGGDGKTFFIARGTEALYFSAHALTSPIVTKHSAENEMGTNIRQLQERRGGNPLLV